MKTVFAVLRQVSASGVRPVMALAWVVLVALPVRAVPYADQPAALLAYPYVLVDSASVTDTFFHLANTSVFPIDVLCFYENATGHCVGSGAACLSDADCAPETCAAGWSAVNFVFRLTPEQPIRWQASKGLSVLPLSANQGAIPPVPELPFIGALRCLAVDPSGAPLDHNNLIGRATIETYQPPDRLDVVDYNAIGLHAVGVGPDNVLTLGGSSPEYEACPQITVVEHSFAGALDPITMTSVLDPILVVIPCSVDYEASAPASATLSYEVFDEFEVQMAGQVALANGQLFAPLSEIGPAVFQAAARGTITGNTRITSDASGILAIVLDRHRSVSDPQNVWSAARNVAYQQARTSADTIVLPGGVVPTPTPTRTPTNTPTVTLTPTPSPEATATAVPAGGSATTDGEGDGATPQDPVETTVTSPNAGVVSILEQAGTPGNFQLVGQEVSIEAPPASPADPLMIVFRIDASAIPAGQDASTIEVFRNGVLVPSCSGAAGVAAPDPCVASRVTLPDGDVQLTVLTSAASVWTFAIRRVVDPCADVPRRAGGLCHAFCEAVNCDVDPSGHGVACERLRRNFCRHTGYEPPCLTLGRVSCDGGVNRGRADRPH